MTLVREERTITIDLAVHKETKLMVATSNEMRGLIVHGRTERELQQRIPEAIRAILEADGFIVESVEPVIDDNELASDFVPSRRKFHAVAAQQ